MTGANTLKLLGGLALVLVSAAFSSASLAEAAPLRCEPSASQNLAVAFSPGYITAMKCLSACRQQGDEAYAICMEEAASSPGNLRLDFWTAYCEAVRASTVSNCKRLVCQLPTSPVAASS